MQSKMHKGSSKQSIGIDRREMFTYTSAFGASFLARQGLIKSQSNSEPETRTLPRSSPPKRYDMKKSINMWAFPYPDRWSLKECLELAKDAGFDGVELTLDSPASSRPSRPLQRLRKAGTR